MLTRFSKYVDAGFLDCLIPILPANALLAPGSTVSEAMRGKVPGQWNVKDQVWSGMASWTSRIFTIDDTKRWDRWPECSIGIKTRVIPTVDIDCDLTDTVRLIRDCLNLMLGWAPVRGREGSARVAMPYHLADGETPTGKIRIVFKLPGAEVIHAVEFLNDGQQFVVEGIHPKGMPYEWDKDLVNVTLGGLTVISNAEWVAAASAVEDLLISMGFEIVKKHTSGIGGDEFNIGDARLLAKDKDDAVAALFSIPNDGSFGYDDWVPIIFAYKAAVGGDEAYYPQLEEWSAQHPDNTSEMTQGRWSTIDTSTIGATWLYAKARSFGWTGGVDDFDDTPVTDPTPNAAGADEKGTANIFTRYVYVEKQDGFYDRKSNTIIKPRTLDIRHNINNKYWVSSEKASTVYFENHVKRTMADNVTFWPGKEQLIKSEGKLLVNTWHASNAIEVREGGVSLFLDLLRKLYPEEREQNILLDKMSYGLLHPDIKPNWHCLLFSLPGAGKDSLLRPLFMYLGSNGVVVSAETLLGGFNEFVMRQQVLIGELRSFQRKSLFDKLKLYLATPPDWLTVNEKFEKLFQIPNLSTWWFTTNEPDCIAFDNTDRRLCVLQSPMTKKEIDSLEAQGPDGKTYFQRYHEWLNAGGAGAVIHFLRTRELTQGFNPQGRAPWTEAKGDMAEATLTEAQRWIIEQVRDQSDDRMFQPALVTREDVLQYARNSLLPEEERKGLTLAKVSEALRAAGAIQVAKFRLGGRGTEQRRVWAIRRQEALAQYKPVELRKIYLIERVGDPAFAEFAGV